MPVFTAPGEAPKSGKKQTWQEQKQIIEILNAALGGDDTRQGR
jgi:hypothetical protein